MENVTHNCIHLNFDTDSQIAWVGYYQLTNKLIIPMGRFINSTSASVTRLKSLLFSFELNSVINFGTCDSN